MRPKYKYFRGIMKNYEKHFRSILLKEQGFNPGDMGDGDIGSQDMSAPAEQPVAAQDPSDEQVWADSNPDISNNDDLNSVFNTEGLGVDEIEKYSEIIRKWGDGIDYAIKQLAEIIRFSAGEKLAKAPGSEQFASLIKEAPKLKKELSAFKSTVEDLEQTVKLAISDDAVERRNKIDSLKS